MCLQKTPRSPADVVAAHLIAGAAAAASQADLPSWAAAGAALLHQVAASQAPEAGLCAAAAVACKARQGAAGHADML
jgi:hypothetical protein